MVPSIPEIRLVTVPVCATVCCSRSTSGALPSHHRVCYFIHDAAAAVAQVRGCPTQATWGPGSGARRLLRIDHAFTSGFRAEEFQVFRAIGSDHDAIVIDLSFAP